VFLPTIQRSPLDNLTPLMYPTPNAPSLIPKVAATVRLYEICNKLYPPGFSFGALALVMNSTLFSKGVWQYVRFPRPHAQKERDWMQHTIKLKRDLSSPPCVHHIFLSFSLPLGILPVFSPNTSCENLKKTISKGSLNSLQAEQSSLSHNSFNNFLW